MTWTLNNALSVGRAGPKSMLTGYARSTGSARMNKLSKAQRRVLSAWADGRPHRVHYTDVDFIIAGQLSREGLAWSEYARSHHFTYRITEAGRAALQQSAVGEGEG